MKMPRVRRPVRRLSHLAPPARVLAALLAGTAAIGLGFTVLQVPAATDGLGPVVANRLAESGVEHPITAVLLNFRSYDTWLEIAVLVLGAIAILTLRASHDLAAVPRLPPSSPLLVAATRLIFPAIVLTAGYLLWLGTHAPGGAFQAGAVLGAGGVLLREAGYRSIAAIPGPLLRAAVVPGFVALLVVAAATLLADGTLLAYPRAHAGTIIVVVELFVGLSIGTVLALLFAGAQPAPPDRDAEEEPDQAARRQVR
jgi:multisubunit Na+/H+ antiporter MnhB subunit